MVAILNYRKTLKKSHTHLHIVGNAIVKFEEFTALTCSGDFFLISWLTKPPSHENAKSEKKKIEKTYVFIAADPVFADEWLNL